MTDAVLLEYVVTPFTSKLLDLTLGRFQVVHQDHRDIPDFIALCRQEIEALVLGVCKMDARALAAERKAASGAGGKAAPPSSSNSLAKAAGDDKNDDLQQPVSGRATPAGTANHSFAAGGSTTSIPPSAATAAASSSDPQQLPLAEQHKQLLTKYDTLHRSELFLRSTLSELIDLLKVRDVSFETLQGVLQRRQKEMTQQRQAYYRELRYLREMVQQFREKGKCDLPDASLHNWDDESANESNKAEADARLQAVLDEAKKAFEVEKETIEQRCSKALDETRSKLRLTESRLSAQAQQTESLREQLTTFSMLAGSSNATTLVLPDGTADRDVVEAASQTDADLAAPPPSTASPATLSTAKPKRVFPMSAFCQTDITMSLFADDREPHDDPLETQLEVFRLCRPSVDLMTALPVETTPPAPVGLQPTPRSKSASVVAADEPLSPVSTISTASRGSKPTAAVKNPPATATTTHVSVPKKKASAGGRGSAAGLSSHGVAITTTTSNHVLLSEHEDRDITSGWPVAASRAPAAALTDASAVASLASQGAIDAANDTIAMLRAENQKLRETLAASRPQSASRVPQPQPQTPVSPGGNAPADGTGTGGTSSRPTSASNPAVQLRRIRDELKAKAELLATRETELTQLRLEMDRWFSQYAATVPKNTTAVGVNVAVVDKLRAAVTAAEGQEEAYRVLSWKLLRQGLAFRAALDGQLEELRQARSRDHAGTALHVVRATEVLQAHIRHVLCTTQERRMAARQAANVGWDRVLLLARGLAAGSADVVFPSTPRYYRPELGDAQERHLPVEVFAAPGNSTYFKAVSHAACAYSVEQVLSLYTQDAKTGIVALQQRPASAAASRPGSAAAAAAAAFPQRLRKDVAAAPPASNQWEEVPPVPPVSPGGGLQHRLRPQSAKPTPPSVLRHMHGATSGGGPASSSSAHRMRTAPKPFFNPGGLNKLTKQEQRQEVLKALHGMAQVTELQRVQEAHDTYHLRDTCGTASHFQNGLGLSAATTSGAAMDGAGIFAGMTMVKLVGKNELR